MRLSEAIRLGSMLKPQDLVGFRRGGRSCALGAACDALGVPVHHEDDFAFGLHALNTEFPQLTLPARCPACSALRGLWRRWRDEEYDLGDVIIHLNDDHKWTRERISDWLATIERRAEAVLPAEAKRAVAPAASEA